MPEKTHFQITHNTVADGSEPFPIGTPLPVTLFPWTAKKLAEQRGVVSFARPEELPAEAAADKQAWEKFGIGPGLFIPVAVLRSSEYSFGTSSAKEDRNCPEEYIPRLRLLGELFVNAVERSRGELALRQQKDEIERLKLQLEKENLYLRYEIKTVQGFEKIVGNQGAFLIDISRGGVVDHGALVEALTEQRLGRAALDVYPVEPLPDSSPLWELPNVILSPHIAGASGDYFERATDVFRENLRRYLAGQPLLNRYDRQRGY